MSGFEIAVLSRWLHIVSVVVLVGGSFFMRFVLIPAAKDLPADQHDLFRDRVLKRWKMLVHPALLFLIVSGVYNLVLAMGVHRKDVPYHMTLGVKLFLAVGVIFLAIALTAKGEWSANLRKSSKLWLSLNLLLAMGVIGISSYLKVRGVPAGTPAAAAAVEAKGEAAAPVTGENAPAK